MSKAKNQHAARSPKENFSLYRRQFLYGSVVTGLAGFLQACGGKGFQSQSIISAESGNGGNGLNIPSEEPPVSVPVPQPQPQLNPQPQPQPNANPTPRPIPINKVNLSDFGGVPGASGNVIINAFNQAFAKLKSLGGGTLFVAPGNYNLGSFPIGYIITVSDLSNVLISAYGAQMQMTTTATETMKTPVFFSFESPENVTVAGMSFYDFGTNIGNRSGAICLDVIAHRRCSGFKTVDVVAENVINLFVSDQRGAPYLFEGFDIHGTVKNSYYGVTMLRNGRFSKANLTCLNVRRAFISHGTRDWDIHVTTHRTGGLGSNAHVVLDPFPDAIVQDCTINIKASGELNGYVSLGSICHQGPDGSYSVARNVKFNFDISNATSAATTGVISLTAEPESGLPAGGIRSSTNGAFENIQITGTVSGAYAGRLVANPSVSSAPTNSVYVAKNIAAMQNLSLLPSYFKVMT